MKPDCAREGCGCVAEFHRHDHHGTYCGRCGPLFCPSYTRPRRRWLRALLESVGLAGLLAAGPGGLYLVQVLAQLGVIGK